MWSCSRVCFLKQDSNISIVEENETDLGHLSCILFSDGWFNQLRLLCCIQLFSEHGKWKVDYISVWLILIVA